MKINVIKDTGVIYNITNAVSRIVWKGSASEAARRNRGGMSFSANMV